MWNQIFPWVMVSVSVTAIWGIINSNRTFFQRKKLLDALFSKFRDWPGQLANFNQVSYERHMWHLMTFRDPMMLYPQELVEAAKDP